MFNGLFQISYGIQFHEEDGKVGVKRQLKENGSSKFSYRNGNALPKER